MDWHNILANCVQVLLDGVLIWASGYIVTLVKKKTDNEKVHNTVEEATDIVTRSVKNTYQTYVEALKNRKIFDKDAQTEALHRALDAAKKEMTDETKDFLTAHYGDAEEWIKKTIETVIYDLKK